MAGVVTCTTLCSSGVSSESPDGMRRDYQWRGQCGDRRLPRTKENRKGAKEPGMEIRKKMGQEGGREKGEGKRRGRVLEQETGKEAKGVTVG